jgi:hypothetical protein
MDCSWKILSCFLAKNLANLRFVFQLTASSQIVHCQSRHLKMAENNRTFSLLLRKKLNTVFIESKKGLYFFMGISDIVPPRFLLKAGSNTTIITRHHYHHFPTLSLEQLNLSLNNL